MTVAARNTWVGRVIVEELARLQTPLVCLAPGARCAPLSMALGATRQLPWVTFVDERAAAFHALGVGRATGRPAAVVTTSGTAVGNLVPAAMEADSAGVPLLLLTADRPAELRQTGSNQTVQQADLLAPLARYRVDLPCSDPALPYTAILSTLGHAVAMARRLRGPVHVNLQFREPLGPAQAPVPDAIASWWSDADAAPWTTVHPSRAHPTRATQEQLQAWSGAKRGLIVVGSLQRSARASAARLVQRLGWPTYASPDSGVRGGLGLGSALADAELAERLAPDVVVWIGGHIVSKRIVTWLHGRRDDLELVSVDDRDARTDPAFRVRHRLVLDSEGLVERLPAGRPDGDWLATWQMVDRVGGEVVGELTRGWNELAAARAALLASRGLFLGASLPVRLVDWVGADGHDVHIDANRGASGIDGVIATATGWARHVEGPVRVLLGDLTCLHDQGSLPMLRQHGVQAVVLNNQGGSIFGMLPFGQVEGFDRVFRNAHEQGLAPLARAHGLRTAVVEDLDALSASLQDPEIDLVEARFAHDDTLAALQQLHTGTRASLRAAWGLG